MYKIMTPGPTQVAFNVRMARTTECTNPDLDTRFFEFYRSTCKLISKLLKTSNETLILSGEGVLGLEAACASLTEPGDRVLVIDNGVFGAGFKDFVSIYGGNPVVFKGDYDRDIEVDKLADFLEKDHDFKYATVVHCDTPSAVLNDISRICPLLKKYDIATVVDSVSATFGEPVDIDGFGIDVLCGGSQKVVSAPPGLCFVTISDLAKDMMKNRKTPIASFYANLRIFEDYYQKKWFPYTMPISDLYGLRAAIDNINGDSEIYDRHRQLAEKTRKLLTDAGYKLYPKRGYSNTVTAIEVPEGTTDIEILEYMKREHGIMLAGSFGPFAGKLIRIGHMGENAREKKVDEVIEGLVNFINER